MKKSTIQELITKQELPVTAQNLIITTPRTSCIYFKPKIHKPDNPGRPIVLACSCSTELISSYLDKVMTPIVKSLPSYIKDSNHALEIVRNFNFSGENKIICNMDITSLYTVIPNNEGLQALKYVFNQRPIKQPSSETLPCLAELVLTLNCFSFGDNYYKQINGVAMGTNMGPSYAKLFVGFIENKFFSNYHGPKPDLYKRYIDDCVGATSSSREELNLFINSANSLHPALKYRPHYKLHRTKKPTEFHSPLPTIHKTLQSKMSFSKTSKFSAMITKLNTYFLYHHSFHSNATKT